METIQRFAEEVMPSFINKTRPAGMPILSRHPSKKVASWGNVIPQS